MSEALPYVEQPAKRPPGVTARQWRLAVLYPRFETAKEACLRAGYSLQSADKASGRLSGALGTLRATAALAEARRDSARDIKAFSASRVLAEVKKPDADPSFALSSWATASKVVAEYPDEEQGIGDAERNTARDYMIGIVSAVLASAGIALDDVAQRVDAALSPPYPTTTS